MAYHATKQQTLGKAISCEGIGLHSGHMVQMTLRPAPVGSGVVFVRTDIAQGQSAEARVPALYHAVTDTMLGTKIENSYGTKVSTIEHLMAAFWGLGVDNAIVELDAAEVPIMDGSSEPFIALIQAAGVQEQAAARHYLKVDKPIAVKQGESEAVIYPYNGFELDVSIAYDHEAIPTQREQYNFDEETFEEALCDARTFGFVKEVEHLKSIGLARGGSLDNAIVIGDEGVLNEDGLRSDDEFIRHKALDCVGDYFLSGMRILGRVVTTKPGHGINNQLLKAVFAQKDAWHIVSGGEGQQGALLADVAPHQSEKLAVLAASSGMRAGATALVGAAMYPEHK